jgi:hypothetical protein
LPEIYGVQLYGYLDGSIEASGKETTVKDKDSMEMTIPNPDYARWVAQDQSVLGFLVRNMGREVLTQMVGLRTSVAGCLLCNLRHEWCSSAPGSTNVTRRIK